TRTGGFCFSSRSRHTRLVSDWSSDVCSSDLLRPGRFDRQIVVAQPDLNGRRGILKVHARGKPMGPDVDLDMIARRTPGFTGADQIGRASCRERVESSVRRGALKKKKTERDAT